MSHPVIGFIGLGQMGFPMVQRLVDKGFRVIAHDTDPARVTELNRACGGKIGVINSTEDWAVVDVLITMLPNSAIVESVLLENGVVPALKQGATVIDMSSSEPLKSRKLEKELATRGLSYIDAPVSGGVKRAQEAKLAVMVGGDSDVGNRVRPILEAMGNTIIHVGPAGAGHAAKALNNYVSAAHLVATVEALHAADQFGIDPNVMTDVLNASSGRNATSENKAKQFMLNGSFGSGFALKLMAKDVRIADDLIHGMHTSSVLADNVLSIWAKFADTADSSVDHTAMYKLLRSDRM